MRSCWRTIPQGRPMASNTLEGGQSSLNTELLQPGCEQGGDGVGLLVGGEVSGVGESVEFAAAGCGAQGFHLGGRDGEVFAARDSEDGNMNCGDRGNRIRTDSKASLHGNDSLGS